MFSNTCAIILFISFTCCHNVSSYDSDVKRPSILVVLLARNKEHTLPYFLSQFEQLSYPKHRMSLFVRSDHNTDKTIPILKQWLVDNEHNYHSINKSLDESGPTYYEDEELSTDWTNDRFAHIISIKEEALDLAKQMWADYIWFLDADAILMNLDIVNLMIDEDKAIIAPMLNSLGTYSNYWCGMSSDYWYVRTEQYIPILERKEVGCFPVPMVHSCVFVNMNLLASNKLSFEPDNVPGYSGPLDDIITFAISAKTAGLEMTVCNQETYGFIPPPLGDKENLSKDYLQMLSLKLEVLVHHPPLKVSNSLQKYVHPQPKKSKWNFDEVYLVNLLRRSERRERMYQNFDELGIDVKFFEAVDGSKLNHSSLHALGIKQLEVYKDPWAQRDMTFGEIGCFLSHYKIWKEVVDKQYESVLLFEDDIRFEPYFKEKLQYLMNEVNHKLKLDWDLIYLGRKKLKHSDEPWVEGSEMLVHVDYSYWTLCYILSLKGARKLLDGDPLGKLVPVDEYIPIMFDKHPEDIWSINFKGRTLNAYSAAPLLVFPTHYTGDKGYISDTEASDLIIEGVDTEEDIKDSVIKNDIGLNIKTLVKDEM